MPQIGSYHEPYQWKPKIQLNACAKVDDIEWPRSIDTVSVVGPSAVTAILLRKAQSTMASALQRQSVECSAHSALTDMTSSELCQFSGASKHTHSRARCDSQV